MLLAVIAFLAESGCNSGDSESWIQHEKEVDREFNQREPLPASPGARTLHEADHAESEWDDTLASPDQQAKPMKERPESYVIREQRVDSWRMPAVYVDETANASMSATWNCNGWIKGIHPELGIGQTIKICGWQ